MTRTKPSPSPLAEDAAPLGDVHSIEGDEAAFAGITPVVVPPSGEVPGLRAEVERQLNVPSTEGDEVPEIPASRAPEIRVAYPPEPVRLAEGAAIDRTIECATTHALDAAPVGSKIVVVRVLGVLKAMLAQPDFVEALKAGDPASKLPEGAVIRKVGEGRFEAHQLSPAIEYPVLKTATAGEAISGFVPHFHRN